MSGEDVAVLEYVPGDFSEPMTLAFIGRSRDDGFIDDHYEDSMSVRTCHLRIRYLNPPQDQRMGELKALVIKLLQSDDVRFFASAIEICCEGGDKLDGEELEKSCASWLVWNSSESRLVKLTIAG